MFKNEFVDAMKPVSRLLGHSLSCAMGFVGLAIISLIPIIAVKSIVALGAEELANPLRMLESFLIYVDIILFLMVFLSGVIVFAVDIFRGTIKTVNGTENGGKNE